MIGAELDRLEHRPDKKGHEPATLLHPNGTKVLTTTAELNAVCAQLIFGLATGTADDVACRNCAEPIEYVRGISAAGGVSTWWHVGGGVDCVWVRGQAEPPASYYENRRPA